MVGAARPASRTRGSAVRKQLIFAVVLLTACASAGPPPGGPEDKVAPKIVRVTPDTNAVNVGDRNASFYFDEVVNDRGPEIDTYFLVSPSDGAPNISWHRTRIDVRPRHGFKPNTAYTITLLPGLTDLSANRMKAGMSLVFSTGPTIPRDNITGIAFDWVAERPAAQALIEAIMPDSTRYLAQADSLGRFTIGPMPPGTYVVRGTIDANNNRASDRNEMFDTVRVDVPSTKGIELLAAARDSLPARLGTITATDSVTLNVTFDRVLDPQQRLSLTQFRLMRADSTAIPIATVRTPREQRAADSANTLAKTDSLRRADSLAGRPLAPMLVPLPLDTVGRNVRRPPPPPPRPSRPPPFNSLTIKLERPVTPATTYKLSVTGLRALSGRSIESERSFTTPRPPPKAPADSTKAAPVVTLPKPPAR